MLCMDSVYIVCSLTRENIQRDCPSHIQNCPLASVSKSWIVFSTARTCVLHAQCVESAVDR